MIFLVVAYYSYSQNLATKEVLLNTFLIITDSGSLTGFLINKDNEEYLITAKHGFKKRNINNCKVSIKLLYDSIYITMTGTYYIHKDSSVDIAVIKLSRNLAKLTPLLVSKVVSIGENCMFFGYPYSTFFTKTNIEYIPFVKKATISAFNKNLIFLDGINNPGFSGGPVIKYDPQIKRNVIVAVISGFYPEYNSVTDSLKNKMDLLNFYINSGIIFSYRIGLVDEIIP